MAISFSLFIDLLNPIIQQNDVDCGPTTCAIVLYMCVRGLPINGNGEVGRPKVECAHITRNRILKQSYSRIPLCYQTWKRLHPRLTYLRPVLEDVVAILEQGLADYLQHLRVEQGLAKARDTCCACRAMRPKAILEKPEGGHLSPTPSSSRRSSSSYSPHCSTHEVSERIVVSRKTMPQYLKNMPEMKRARRKEMMEPRRPMFRNGAPVLAPRRFEMLPRSRFRDFDDYYNGPTLEDARELMPKGGLEGYPIPWYAQPTIRSCWELFKDYGYRLEPEFPLMFQCTTPQKVLEHLLPPTLTDLQSEKRSEKHLNKHSHTDRFGHRIRRADKKVMGMEEMLDAAGEEGSMESMKMFVQGKTAEDKYIILDPTRDQISMSSDDMHLSLDIDSFIVSTPHLGIITADIEVHVLPYQGKKPPISRNNHTYIEVLLPQSEQDKDSGGRSEWYSTKHSLSVIPHTHFAKVNRFNIYVFFPRMIHKDPVTGNTATMLPWEVQSLWLTDVVYPAIIAGENPTTMVYKDYTLDEWRWKASIKKRFEGKAKTVHVAQQHIEDMQGAMQEITQGDDDLDLFRSFFFVMDARGIKDYTNIIVGQEGDPYQELRQKFDILDWNALDDRCNGQVLMDLGLAFHPVPEDNVPLVALWDLLKVHGSYDRAGMNAGTVHYSGTMPRYGGRQAEMNHVRSSLVQLVFRSTYCLYYQTVRKAKGGDIHFCEDVEAFEVTDAFVSCIDGYLKMLKGGIKKTYGVRDEIRGSFAAIRDVVGAVEGLVSSSHIRLPTLCSQCPSVADA
jgi:hypothetical protein